MAESVTCNVCGQEATVHLTQIVNNKVQKVDLCETCAQAKGVMDPGGFGLSEIFGIKSKASSEKECEHEDDEPNCTHCGLTGSEFKKKGRLGCGECYTQMGDILYPVLEDLHRGLKHHGKVPHTIPVSSRAVLRRLKEAHQALTMAIKEERFEDAAHYRDQIQEYQKRLGPLENTKSKIKK